jgi:hypothetical protein
MQPSRAPNRYRLPNARIEEYPLPELDFGILRRLDRIAVQGLLGLDFLIHFGHIHFHTRSMQLVLEP